MDGRFGTHGQLQRGVELLATPLLFLPAVYADSCHCCAGLAQVYIDKLSDTGASNLQCTLGSQCLHIVGPVSFVGLEAQAVVVTAVNFEGLSMRICTLQTAIQTEPLSILSSAELTL